jgi:hypothetical protein
VADNLEEASENIAAIYNFCRGKEALNLLQLYLL